MTEEDTTADETNAADRIVQLERTVETLADRVVELETDRQREVREETDGTRPSSISRRAAMGILGSAGLLGIGATTASADSQGRVGTEEDPLRELYTEVLRSPSALKISTGHGADVAGNIVAGHSSNSAGSDVRGATIAGGGYDDGFNEDYHEVTGNYGTVSGGMANIASAFGAAVAGGSSNTASGAYATTGGGERNEASGENATVGGGQNNAATAELSTIAGGLNNEANSRRASVGGGMNNTASAVSANVSGGVYNTASGFNATVPGGTQNTAAGEGSFAAGQYADAGHDNAFVWADITNPTETFSSGDDPNGSGVTGEKTFHVKASNGVRFVTGAGTTYIPGNGTGWSTTSTRTAKTNVEPVDPSAALAGVESMPVSTWEYEGDDGDGAGTTHIGPMAEDFHDAFDVGTSDRHINSINADGVALAAIKGLAERLDEREARSEEQRDRIEEQRDRIDDLEAENENLHERLDALEALVANGREPRTASRPANGARTESHGGEER